MVAISPLLLVVALVLAATFALMLRDKITSRMSVRNITRRRTTVVLVVAGLLVGTAMISGSLVTGDTMNSLFTRGAYFSYGAVDESVYSLTSQGGYAFFNYSTYSQVSSSIQGIPHTAGVTPLILYTSSLFDNNTKVGQPGVVLIGANPNATSILGNFTSANGSVINPNIGDGGAILNDAAARDLNASIGDMIQIIAANGKSASFLVKGIDKGFERSGFPGESDHVVITLTAAQALLNEPSKINFIAITNSGGIHQGIVYTNVVGTQANTTLQKYLLPNGEQLYAYGSKNESVTSAATGAQFLSTFFLTTSSFTIIAGIVLIINIFVMLAEERKKEMGMARAVGMKRRHLTKLFLFEGTQYAIISAVVGVFAGIAIAYGILYFFGRIIISFASGLSINTILESFTITPETLITSFSAGLLITYLTILLASWRVSKLNIIRAIRDIPEPPVERRTYTILFVLGVILLGLGVLTFYEGISQSDLLGFLLGPSIGIIGVGLVLSRFIKNRYAFSLSSIALLVYWSIPFLSWNNPAAPSAGNGFTQYVAGGILMVISAVLLVTYNTDLLMRGITRIFRVRSSWIPVLKIGLSYPGSKKFRTAITIFMFALVMFTVIFISVLITLDQESMNASFQANSGGYDLIVTTSAPVAGLQDKISHDSNVSSYLSSVITFSGGYTLSKDLTQPNSTLGYNLYVGANSSATGKDNFFTTNTFNITSAMPAYVLPGGKIDTQKVWNAVESNSSNVVLSTSLFGGAFGPPSGPTQKAGDMVSLVLPNRTMTNVTIIAIMSGGALSGYVSTEKFVGPRMNTNASQFGLIALASSSQADHVAIDLKRDFLSLGMQVVVLPDILNQILGAVQSFFALFQGFLALGLIVGIAGLSIIAIRAVVERRQEIGMVRALGFTRRMVLGSFLVENSFVALLGIVIGVLLAVDLGYAFATTSSPPLAFNLPYLNILEIILIAYLFAMVGTVFSAFRAARILPAEALRYIE